MESTKVIGKPTQSLESTNEGSWRSSSQNFKSSNPFNVSNSATYNEFMNTFSCLLDHWHVLGIPAMVSRANFKHENFRVHEIKIWGFYVLNMISSN